MLHERLQSARAAVQREVAKVVVGMDAVVDAMFVAMLARGHILLEGVPGTAKTLTVRAFAEAVGLTFGRIQFTPDLMPSDVVGTNIYDLKAGSFRLAKGPIFAEVILADEINRAPPKTQSALLEAMQEQQVTIDGQQQKLSDHFMVLATQNPVEQEGTYPLPEAQLDRFLLKIVLGYPDQATEDEILRRSLASVQSTTPVNAGIVAVLHGETIAAIRQLGLHVRVEDNVRRYVRDLARATRSSPMIALGAGPRAAVHLLVAAQWFAALGGRLFVTPDDVVAMLAPTLGHRLILTPEVELDGLKQSDVLAQLARSVEVPR